MWWEYYCIDLSCVNDVLSLPFSWQIPLTLKYQEQYFLYKIPQKIVHNHCFKKCLLKFKGNLAKCLILELFHLLLLISFGKLLWKNIEFVLEILMCLVESVQLEVGYSVHCADGFWCWHNAKVTCWYYKSHRYTDRRNSCALNNIPFWILWILKSLEVVSQGW